MIAAADSACPKQDVCIGALTCSLFGIISTTKQQQQKQQQPKNNNDKENKNKITRASIGEQGGTRTI